MVYLGIKNGQPQTGKYNFWASFFAASMFLALQYWGGFYDALLSGGAR